MKSITLKSYAKINLSIDVLGKRPDGYHQVEMVMQQIDLYDKVTVNWEEKSVQENEEAILIEIQANLSYIPTDDRNIAYKAAKLMSAKYLKEKQGIITIQLMKNIPVSAGLAGGSSNGAAVIHGLSKLWNLNLSVDELKSTAEQLGADVPFCIAGQAALNKELDLWKDEGAGSCAVATGIGQSLEMIPSFKSWVVLSKPAISISTAKVYGDLNLAQILERPNTKELVQGIKQSNLQKITKNMVNVLENVTLKEYPIVMYTKNNMQEICKGKKILMSGSGPTLFALYQTKGKGKIAYEKLKEQIRETYFVKSL